MWPMSEGIMRNKETPPCVISREVAIQCLERSPRDMVQDFHDGGRFPDCNVR